MISFVRVSVLTCRSDGSRNDNHEEEQHGQRRELMCRSDGLWTELRQGVHHAQQIEKTYFSGGSMWSQKQVKLRALPFERPIFSFNEQKGTAISIALVRKPCFRGINGKRCP